MEITAGFRQHRSFIVNIYIALNYFIFVVGALYYSFLENTLDYNIIAYTLHSAILIFFIVIRRPHRRFDMSLVHQGVALAGFYLASSSSGSRRPAEPPPN